VSNSPSEKRIRERAERKLRFRSKLLGAGLGLIDLLILFVTIGAWVSWYAAAPGLAAWWHEFSSSLGTASFSTLADRLATFPGGVPWPLALTIELRVIFLIGRAIARAVFNYVNFQRTDRVHRRYEWAMQREINGLMIRERLMPGWLDSTRDQWDWSSSEIRRRLDKIRRWIQMYDQVPDTPEVEKAKVKHMPTGQQTVRLGEDGELIYDYEEEPEKAQAASVS
jgi:hypothetical protein